MKAYPWFACWLCALLSALVATTYAADDGASDDQETEFRPSEVLFTRRIGPLLREKCLACHGDPTRALEGGLDLQFRDSVLTGGDSGKPGVVPGRADDSALYLAASRNDLTLTAMPPKESEALQQAQLKWLREWINSGAEWPSPERQSLIHEKYVDTWTVEDGVRAATSGGLSAEWSSRSYDPAGLWAYQPIEPGILADLAARDRNPIDVLIDDAMPTGLTPAPRASRRTLIRRATFDLTGLPPTPAEVDAFLGDARSDVAAFSAVVERLLASPHYGERMAQHWLDVVRYADSAGFANDFDRGNAWRYRDYVIRSFNSDKPFDQFVREQIAGDEIEPDNPEAIIATGFLRMGPWELTAMEVAKIARQRFLDDVTNSVGETFLGHSLQCARCHDHKFDPVPTRDYYAIQAVFATTQLAERSAAFLSEENTTGFDEERYLQMRQRDYDQTLDQLDSILLDNAQAWYAERQLPTAEWNEAVAKEKQSTPHRSIFDAARNAVRQGKAEGQFPPRFVGFTPEQFGLDRVARKGKIRLRWELDRYRPYALAVYDGRTPTLNSVDVPQRVPEDRMQNGILEVTCILAGGDPFSSLEPTTPGVLSVLLEQLPAKIPNTIEGRRKALADWIANSNNPLTTRVIANRIWQWHFGEAIAGNPNNFGSTGKRPTHPRLLDWLAAKLIDANWSIKSMHRDIMCSDAYCRSTQHPDREQLTHLDPLGDRYAAFKPRRLSAEELRDTMLAVSGELNTTLGGIPVRPVINEEVALQPRMVMGTFAAAWTPNPLPAQRNRRSIYVQRLRGLTDPLLDVFNAPGPDFSCERRETSTVTPQVFALFNSRSTHARALALADDLLKETPNDRGALTRCFRLLLARDPNDNELDECIAHWQFIERSLPRIADRTPPPPIQVQREAVEENTGERFTFSERLYSSADFVPDLQPHEVSPHVRAFADICLVLLNCNEFVYVE